MSENKKTQENESEQQSSPMDYGTQERRPKNKLKKSGKKAAGNLADAFKQGFKEVWKALPLKVKLIIACIIGFFVLIASCYIVLADNFVKSSTSSISTHYNAEGSTASEKGKQEYNSTGSMVYSDSNDVKEIAKNFFETVKPQNLTLYEFLSKKYKNGDPDNSGVPLKQKTLWFGEEALDINANKTLYEHLLNAERYNFNKIRWIKYNRDANEGMLPLDEMAVDEELELQYPDDSAGTTMDEFKNMVRPYLQSWIIPYGLFAGLLTDGTGSTKLDYGQYAYQILIKAYHQIVMNQYNLQVETHKSTQNVYDIQEYTVERYQINLPKKGWITIATAHVPNNSTGKNYTIIESCHQDDKVNDAPEITYDVVYKLESAKMFDRIIENTYLVHKYNIATDTPEHYITREEYAVGREKTSSELANLDDSVFKYAPPEGDVRVGTYTYTAKKGYTQKETKIWRDTIETVSEKDRVLTTNDVVEYINPEQLTEDEKLYYDKLAVEENIESVRLTLADLVNAKKDIYKTYLRGESNYSENIGYARSYMVFSYDTLKKHVKSIAESDTGWQYLYGASLGLDIETKKSTTISINPTSSLIKDYDASGVLKAMQDVYAENNLKDYKGYTWDTVKWYPENADYAWNNWKSTVEDIAANYGVDPLWVLAKMSFESGGGKYSGYGTGAAAGPMQIQKSIHLNGTISAVNVKTGETDTIVMTREALGDDKTNIQIGIMMYANHLKECGGNPYLAAQKYNYGNIGFVKTYANRTGKDRDNVISDLNDVGWVYDSMQYHLNQSVASGALWGDGYYAYKFAIYLDYLKTK